MNSHLQKVVRFLRSDDGVAAIEYAALLGLIFLAVLSGITAFGQATNDSMVHSADTLGEALENAEP